MVDLTHAKVLVVDDSSVLRKVIIGSLKELGISAENVTEAGDGAEGVKHALADNFQLIIMDWNMPNMLGIDAVKAIRAAGNKTPILMVTTEGERHRVIAAVQAGANNYLVKPFRGEDLREKLEQMLL
ncbi:MAG TPA: response regulator [Oculatellaceae cyanobacterium]|jgi:two-component system chemotaxis response regulator CheY